jgi:RHS repeat-associated protein
VFFDDLNITHTKGKVLQEDHYYPFGMNISALSSSAPLSKPNNFKYNGFEEQTDFDLGWYDYQARFYDPQLGRFMQVDPAADLMRRHSTYNYAFDNPIKFIDPDGMIPTLGDCPPGVNCNAIEQKTQEIAESVSKKVTEVKEKTGQFFTQLWNQSPLGQIVNSIEAGGSTGVVLQSDNASGNDDHVSSAQEVDNVKTVDVDGVLTAASLKGSTKYGGNPNSPSGPSNLDFNDSSPQVLNKGTNNLQLVVGDDTIDVNIRTRLINNRKDGIFGNPLRIIAHNQLEIISPFV